jgi:hypothetical protein
LNVFPVLKGLNNFLTVAGISLFNPFPFINYCLAKLKAFCFLDEEVQVEVLKRSFGHLVGIRNDDVAAFFKLLRVRRPLKWVVGLGLYNEWVELHASYFFLTFFANEHQKSINVIGFIIFLFGDLSLGNGLSARNVNFPHDNPQIDRRRDSEMVLVVFGPFVVSHGERPDRKYFEVYSFTNPGFGVVAD